MPYVHIVSNTRPQKSPDGYYQEAYHYRTSPCEHTVVVMYHWMIHVENEAVNRHALHEEFPCAAIEYLGEISCKPFASGDMTYYFTELDRDPHIAAVLLLANMNIHKTYLMDGARMTELPTVNVSRAGWEMPGVLAIHDRRFGVVSADPLIMLTNVTAKRADERPPTVDPMDQLVRDYDELYERYSRVVADRDRLRALVKESLSE